MVAYAAIISFRNLIARFRKAGDVFLPPSALQIIEFADKQLKSIQEFVEMLDSSSRRKMNTSLQQIAAATRGFESEFGTLTVGLQYEYKVQNLKQEIHYFIERLKKMAEEYYDENASSSTDVSESKMVGLSDMYNKVKEELVGEWLNNHLLFLVGMAGIGKTTLARKIFEDLDILEWFDCRIWVTIGMEFEWEKIEKVVSAQVNTDAQNLKESLRDKRYFIVLDDVWDGDIENRATSFPRNPNGSRIFLTTRLRVRSINVELPNRRINMRLLDKEESWLLLYHRVIGQDTISLELEKAGKKIVEECDGLPLTIITVADHLIEGRSGHRIDLG